MHFSVYLKIDNETTSVVESVVSSLAFLLTIIIIQSADIQSQLFNPCAAEVSGATFRHLKLEFPMQFPASNDKKYFQLRKIGISEMNLFHRLNINDKISRQTHNIYKTLAQRL